MLTNIKCTRYLGYDAATKLYSYEYELTDSEFGAVLVAGADDGVGAATGAGVAAVISEYSKRNLNVAANLVKLLLLCKQRYDWEIATQIKWWQLYQPLFTAELKAELDKYIALL